MHTNFDDMPQRKNTNSVKWDALVEVFGSRPEDDVIPLWVADMDFPTPPEITEALSRRISEGAFGYTILSASFGSTIAYWMRNRHGASIDPTWVSFSPGVVTGLINAVLAFSNEGEGVLIQPPVYTPFHNVVKDHNRRLVLNPLIETKSSYRIDFEDFEAKASLSDVKLFILCNPHNPVGRVFTYEELVRMGEICVRHNVVMVVDEIHADIVFKPHRHITFTNLPEQIYRQGIVLISPSKSFNLAGFQTSAVIIPDEKLRSSYIRQTELTCTHHINCMGEIALTAAYDKCGYYVDELMEYLTLNKQYAESILVERFPSLSLFTCEGTYLLWIDFRKTGIPISDLDRFLIEEAKIAVDPGHWFGDEGTGFIRINIACPKSVLAEAFDRLRKAMDGYRKD
jgi:cystathionine beta-lyase